MHGWVILDKPVGMTSARAVHQVKKLLKPKKIGHAGTLDPLASGVLPLAMGEATKTMAYMMDTEKAYGFTVSWGEERDTDDREGKVTETSPQRPRRDAIEAILDRFRGAVLQAPPAYSAIKMGGKRAYDMARSGQEMVMQPREIMVHSLEISDYNIDNTSFICHCGKGTYIRSLARDMGRALGCYGHISALRRLKVGKFGESHAISLEVLGEMVHKGDLSFLEPVETALDDIPAVEITSSQALLLKRGQAISVKPLSEEMVLTRENGRVIAICSNMQGLLKPVRVFNID